MLRVSPRIGYGVHGEAVLRDAIHVVTYPDTLKQLGLSLGRQSKTPAALQDHVQGERQRR